jgi:hypothetical protein
MLTRIGVSTSHPLAFVVVGVYVAFWLTLSPCSFDWQSFATVATWVMTLFTVDDQEPEEIERHRRQERR